MNHDDFAQWDAAYVLGALSSSDRAAYEDHLATCPECAVAVRDLAGIPGLLGKVSAEDLEEPVPPPVDLLSGTRAAAGRERSRRRWRTALVAAAAAVVLVGGGIAWSRQQSAPAGVTVAMSPARTNPLTASLRLTDKAWGTQVAMTCSYRSGGWTGRAVYSLYVVDAAGRATSISTWSAGPGTTSRLTAATAVPRADIRALQVRGPDGSVLLTAAPR